MRRERKRGLLRGLRSSILYIRDRKRLKNLPRSSGHSSWPRNDRSERCDSGKRSRQQGRTDVQPRAGRRMLPIVHQRRIPNGVGLLPSCEDEPRSCAISVDNSPKRRWPSFLYHAKRERERSDDKREVFSSYPYHERMDLLLDNFQNIFKSKRECLLRTLLHALLPKPFSFLSSFLE